ncbi:hypothetical protein FSARC_10374 [Fusarium sarcochroum]|uniref:Rhodopsin domain-containing protein n=1 Tax=Fusarium sarcochroum TaxID=1208366 RepID=A0A8H4TMI5_9HYPO|nr:hypothetical protein FSARC_10374 [Fusarium sarcochroum]
MSSYGGRGPTINAILWTESAIAIIFVALRVYTRKVILRSFGLDDFFLIITLALLIVYATLISVGATFGIGQKRDDISDHDYIEAMKYELIGQGVCIFNIATSKAAVAFFILRIVRETRHRIFIWFCIISNTLLATWTTIAVFIQCFPISKVWNPMGVEGDCWLDFTKVGIACSAYAVAIDFTLAIAPCYILWDLNMKRKEKTLALFGLSLGVLFVIPNDNLDDTSNMLIYSGTENFVSAICASIPVLRPLYIRLRGYGSSGDSYPHRSYQMNGFGSQDAGTALGGVGGDREGRMATKIFAGGRDAHRISPDNASEETILRESRKQREQGIQVFTKTDFSIEYSNGGRS